MKLKTKPEERAAARAQSSGIPGFGSTVAAHMADDIDTLLAEVDCGQEGPCAIAPGCKRHWEDRNRELSAEVERLRECMGHIRRLESSFVPTVARACQTMAAISAILDEVEKP